MDARKRYIAEVRFTEEGTGDQKTEYMRFDGRNNTAIKLASDWYGDGLHLRLLQGAMTLFTLFPLNGGVITRVGEVLAEDWSDGRVGNNRILKSAIRWISRLEDKKFVPVSE